MRRTWLTAGLLSVALGIGAAGARADHGFYAPRTFGAPTMTLGLAPGGSVGIELVRGCRPVYAPTWCYRPYYSCWPRVSYSASYVVPAYVAPPVLSYYYQPVVPTTPRVIYSSSSARVPVVVSGGSAADIAAAVLRALAARNGAAGDLTYAPPAAPSQQIAPSASTAPSQPNRTYMYDGGPRNPVPMPRDEVLPQGAVPATVPLEGRSVSLPRRPTPRPVFAAYGEQLPSRQALAEERLVIFKAFPDLARFER